MEIGAAFVYALSAAVTLGSTAGGVAIFAHRLAPRGRLGLKLAALIGVCALLAIVSLSLLPPTIPADPSAVLSYPLQLGLFSVLLALLTAMVTWLFDASVWTALFCCTAGYAIQNFASGLTELVWVFAGVPESQDPTAHGHLVRFVLNLLSIAAVYIPFYLVYARKIAQEALEAVENRSLVAIMVVVMLGIIGFDLLIKHLEDGGLGLASLTVLRCMHGLMCALTYALEYELLVRRRLEVEAAATRRVMAERDRQYEASRQNIEAINIKCHDIRHQIRHLGESASVSVDPTALADIAREVDVYDSTVRTGNEALDTVLTEKRLICARKQIRLSCVADGGALSFISAADLYSFFGNALDNAIEAVQEIEDPAGRSISVVIRKVAGVASIHIENRFSPAKRPVFNGAGGLLTSKDDTSAHGFGVRSMRLTAESYSGTLTTLVEGDTFHVNAIIPLP